MTECPASQLNSSKHNTQHPYSNEAQIANTYVNEAIILLFVYPGAEDTQRGQVFCNTFSFFKRIFNKKDMMLFFSPFGVI